MEWVLGLLQSGFVRWAPPPPPVSHHHFNHCWMWITECKPTSGGGHYLYLQTQFGGDRCTQFRVIMAIDPQTNKQTQPHTHRQDRLQYTAPQLARSVMTSFVDGQLSDIISLHCTLTHDTVPPGSGRGTSHDLHELEMAAMVFVWSFSACLWIFNSFGRTERLKSTNSCPEKMKINLLKNDIKIRYKDTTQPIDRHKL